MQSDGRRFLRFSLFLPFLLLSGGVVTTAGGSEQAAFGEPFKSCQLLTQTDAEKILGQPAKLTNQASGVEGEIRRCRLTYTGVAKDPTSGEDCNLYFSLERKENRPSAEQARQVLESTRNANSHDQEIIALPRIGDEAFLLGDNPDAYFIMARKGAVVIRLQVKKATDKSSLKELKSFAEKIAGLL